MFDSESSSDGGWISWFCDLEGHEFFVEVRYTKVRAHLFIGGCRVPAWFVQFVWPQRKDPKVQVSGNGSDSILKVMLWRWSSVERVPTLKTSTIKGKFHWQIRANYRFLEIYQSAMDLYGLTHARFILSPRGLAMMREKYTLGTFGNCQRILCDR
mgnify:CR=1 FL=1